MSSTLIQRALWLIGLIASLVLINQTISAHERTLTEGRVVRLELAPRDPRAFMQGDYMALRFAMAAPLLEAAKQKRIDHGRAVIAIDANGVGKFVRIDEGAPLAANEARIEFRVRAGDVRIVTNGYFFEEGTASRFDAARFGEFRVRDNGVALLSHLLDEKKQKIPTGKAV